MSLAAFSGLLDPLRELYSSLPLSRMHGYNIRSFTPSQEGTLQEELQQVRFKGISLQELLQTRIGASRDIIGNVPGCGSLLDALLQIGLEYLELGRSLARMSQSERWKLSLARSLRRRAQPVFYLIETPSSGLDETEVLQLLEFLRSVTAQGHSVVCTDNNPLFLEGCDLVVKLGPG